MLDDMKMVILKGKEMLLCHEPFVKYPIHSSFY